MTWEHRIFAQISRPCDWSIWMQKDGAPDQAARQHHRLGQRRGRYGHLVGGAGGQSVIAGIPVGATRRGSSDFQVDAAGNGCSATVVARHRESVRGLAV